MIYIAYRSHQVKVEPELCVIIDDIGRRMSNYYQDE